MVAQMDAGAQGAQCTGGSARPARVTGLLAHWQGLPQCLPPLLRILACPSQHDTLGTRCREWLLFLTPVPQIVTACVLPLPDVTRRTPLPIGRVGCRASQASGGARSSLSRAGPDPLTSTVLDKTTCKPCGAARHHHVFARVSTSHTCVSFTPPPLLSPPPFPPKEGMMSPKSRATQP